MAQLTYREAVSLSIAQCMRKDEKVVLKLFAFFKNYSSKEDHPSVQVILTIAGKIIF